MRTLEDRLLDYGDRLLDLHGPITVDELLVREASLASTQAMTDTDVEVIDRVVEASSVAEPTLEDWCGPAPEVRERASRKGGIAAAVAAVIVLIVGVVVGTDDNRGDDSAIGVSSSVETDPAAPSSAVVQVRDYEWSTVALSETDLGGTDVGLNSVTAGGPGLVAVGSVGSPLSGDAAVWTSTDGVTWSRIPHDPEVFGGLGIQEMTDVTGGGPGLVAVGRASSSHGSDTYPVAAVWTSPDGITWSRVPDDPEVFGGATNAPADMFSMTAVTVGGPGLVAVGNQGGGPDRAGVGGAWIAPGVGVVWTSTDGVEWSRVPHDPEVFGDVNVGEWYEGRWPPVDDETRLSTSIHDITVGGPGLVAVGEFSRPDYSTWIANGPGSEGGAAVWTSPDGLSWTRTDLAEGPGWMEAVSTGGPGLVAVGSTSETPDNPSPAMETWMAAVWTSRDGFTWTPVADDEALGGKGLQGMSDVIDLGTGLVAVGADTVLTDTSYSGLVGVEAPAVWTSPDGTTWTRAYQPEIDSVDERGTAWSVTTGGPGLVALASSHLGPSVLVAQPK